MKKRNPSIGLLSPRTSIVLFSILVVTMPFIMLQNYLQATFREIGGYAINILGIEIPIILLIVCPIILILILINYKKITTISATSFIFILSMLYLGQLSSDFYINYKFYDLQNNWHYLSYCFFTIIMYRYLITKKLPIHKIIIITFLRGLAISLFDEGIQVFISNRVFDLSDVAKDLWGLWIGNISIFFLANNAEICRNYKNILHKRIKDYLNSPLSLIVFQGLFSYIFIFLSSNLTDSNYAIRLIIITIFTCIIVFLISHCCQFRKLRFIIISIFLIGFISISTSFLINKDKGLDSISNCFVVYRGIPIPYFDVFIKPSGFFRLVDKKEQIKNGDLLKLYEYDADIIIFALGENYNSGNKLININSLRNTYFTYNPLSKNGVQIIVLDYNSAVSEYNRLVNENKKVSIVIHNN